MLALLGSLNPDSPAPSGFFLYIHTHFSVRYNCQPPAATSTFVNNLGEQLAAPFGQKVRRQFIFMSCCNACTSCWCWFPQEHAYCYPWINFSYRVAWAPCTPLWFACPDLWFISHIRLIMAIRKMSFLVSGPCPKFILFMCSRRK